ncbi:hypothetical protein [Thermocatellispora tengchongensis]|uniref:hypothetical protein n=1 Tax=Thermocatellispora tengchongensis TaxID=1073253 RepID=UPI0036294669
MLAQRGHFQRWTSKAGWHGWTPPTQQQIKQRMKARRTLRGQRVTLVIIDEPVNWAAVERSKYRMAIGVDFDGVIHAYRQGWKDGTIYDEPMPGALEGLRALMDHHPVFIHTSRSPLPVAMWLRERGFIVDIDDVPVKFWNERGRLLVTNRKIPAKAYLDDRAVRFTSWTGALDELLADGRRDADLHTAFARIDARHQPTTTETWVSCHDHSKQWLTGVLIMCPMCAPRPLTHCTNDTCPTWPCADHLALHGETADTCTHQGGSR